MKNPLHFSKFFDFRRRAALHPSFRAFLASLCAIFLAHNANSQVIIELEGDLFASASVNVNGPIVNSQTAQPFASADANDFWGDDSAVASSSAYYELINSTQAVLSLTSTVSVSGISPQAEALTGGTAPLNTIKISSSSPILFALNFNSAKYDNNSGGTGAVFASLTLRRGLTEEYPINWSSSAIGDSEDSFELNLDPGDYYLQASTSASLTGTSSSEATWSSSFDVVFTATAVPEPSTAVLLVLAGIYFLKRNCRLHKPESCRFNVDKPT